MQADWELSRSFISDGLGVRAACVLSAADGAFRVVAGNQGGGLCEFGVPSGDVVPVDLRHDDAVTALLAGDDDAYATGCKDAVVRIMGAERHELRAKLEGHEKPVTSLAWASAGGGGEAFLVSGSWDGTAKVWSVSRGALVATLPGHENSVCVAGLESATDGALRIATGSAGLAQNNVISGHTLRIWTVDVRTGEVSCVRTVANDHRGPIRDVSATAAAIATASNDGTVKIRSTADGTAMYTLSFLHQSPQPPMLLSVAPVGENMLAASAEDGHVVVWDVGGENTEPQVLLHPNCVWNVIGLPNGDIATCCDDGTLRIFTRSTERVASDAEREQFAASVQEAHQKKSSGPSPEEVAKLTPWEQNATKRGTSEGQVHLFNKEGTAIAAQWSSASQAWIEVGQVMGSQDGGLVDGVQYDHVFPIEVDQTGGGIAKLQIGYNNGENHFVAAQRFIDAHQLPQHHLNDIANYIQQRVGHQATTLGEAGGSAPPAVPTTGVPMASYQYLPVKAYKSFELSTKSAATTLEKMHKKLEEFGKLSEGQLSQVSHLIETLGATNRYHASKVDADDLNVILELLELLDATEVFPALDLARLTVIHPDASSAANQSYWVKVITKAVALCESADSLTGPAAVAIPMLSLRLFANAFREGSGARNAVALHIEDALSCVHKFVASPNKNIRLSAATVLLNASRYLTTNAQAATASRVMTLADSILSARAYESEAMTRALLAVGTIALASPEAKRAAKDMGTITKVEIAASPHGDVAKAIAKEVYNALS